MFTLKMAMRIKAGSLNISCIWQKLCINYYTTSNTVTRWCLQHTVVPSVNVRKKRFW